MAGPGLSFRLLKWDATGRIGHETFQHRGDLSTVEKSNSATTTAKFRAFPGVVVNDASMPGPTRVPSVKLWFHFAIIRITGAQINERDVITLARGDLDS